MLELSPFAARQCKLDPLVICRAELRLPAANFYGRGQLKDSSPAKNDAFPERNADLSFDTFPSSFAILFFRNFCAERRWHFVVWNRVATAGRNFSFSTEKLAKSKLEKAWFSRELCFALFSRDFG